MTILCLCITAFFNVYNLVPCRPTYHFTPIFIMYCMAAFVNHNDYTEMMMMMMMMLTRRAAAAVSVGTY